jgi:hypothetical protein
VDFDFEMMDQDTPIDEISQVEARLEELAEVAERCRKFILASKAAIAGGVAWLLVMVLGLFGSNEVAAIGSIAAVLGGIVSLGSNVSTLEQTMAAISARRSSVGVKPGDDESRSARNPQVPSVPVAKGPHPLHGIALLWSNLNEVLGITDHAQNPPAARGRVNPVWSANGFHADTKSQRRSARCRRGRARCRQGRAIP